MVLKSSVGLVLACAGLSPVAAGLLLHASHSASHAQVAMSPWGSLTAVRSKPDIQTAALASVDPGDLSRHLQLVPRSAAVPQPAATPQGEDPAVLQTSYKGDALPRPQGEADQPASTAMPSVEQDAALSQTEATPSAFTDGAPAANPAPSLPPREQAIPVERSASVGSTAASPADEADSGKAQGFKVRPGMLIDINKAPQSVLDHLPGVGKVGRAIIRHRPYRSIEDLLSRRVLRSSDFQKVKSRIKA